MVGVKGGDRLGILEKRDVAREKDVEYVWRSNWRTREVGGFERGFDKEP